jgi:Tfp pilus assembly protein PilF
MSYVSDIFASAMQFHQAGDLPQAERLYREFLQYDSQHAEAFYYLGTVCLAQSKLDDATAAFQRSLNIRPNAPEVLNNLGVVLARQKRFAEAVESLQQALKYRPNWSELYRNLGNILGDWGDLDGAAEAYAKLVQFGILGTAYIIID